MNKLPLDIVSEPFIKIVQKPIWNTHRTSGGEVEIFRQVQQRVKVATGERVVFDYRKPGSNDFEAANTGWNSLNPWVFIPAQWGDIEKGVLKSHERPKFGGMDGYIIPPNFSS